MEIRCPYCEKTVQVPGGGQFTCPSCRAVFAVDLEPQGQRPAAPPPLPSSPPPLPSNQPTVGEVDPGTARGEIAPPPLPPASSPAPAHHGPVCARHPHLAASEVCKRCGNFMCPTCTNPFRDGFRYCPDCMIFLAGGYGTVANNIPWETERQTAGMMSAWWKTAKACMFGPDQFFREMSPAGGLENPLGFNVLGVTVFGILSQILLLGGLAIFGLAMGGPQAGAGFLLQLAFQLGCGIVAIPIGAAIGVFMSAAIYHVIALILGGNGSFEATFRIVGYGMGSTSMLSIVPYLGPFVGFFWQLIILYHGFLHGHRMSSGRALMVVLIPLLLVGCCVTIAFVAFGSMIIAAIQQGGGRGF